MLVKKWMTKSVITVDKDDYMLSAVKALKEHRIHRVPVLKEGRLIGIVSDEDLSRPSYPGPASQEMIDMVYRLSKLRVEEVMTKNPILIPEYYTIDEAVEILIKNDISGAPVINNDGDMVGIITRTDLLKAQRSMSGLEERGITFALQLKDQPGSIRKVNDLIQNYGGRIASEYTSYKGVPEGFREVYFRMYGIDRQRIQDLSKALSQQGELIYMVDHVEKTRTYY
jgi:acetoin utilization protein AcuB